MRRCGGQPAGLRALRRQHDPAEQSGLPNGQHHGQCACGVCVSRVGRRPLPDCEQCHLGCAEHSVTALCGAGRVPAGEGDASELGHQREVCDSVRAGGVVGGGGRASGGADEELRRLRSERGADARRTDADGERVLAGGAANPRHVREQVLPEEVVDSTAACNELVCLCKHATTHSTTSSHSPVV